MVRDYKNIEQFEIEGSIKNAFVVFKSMEGCERVLRAYKNKRLNTVFYGLCYCFINKEKYQKKLFHGKYLKIDKAIEPSLIMWENLGTTPFVRFLRFVGTSLVALLLLGLTVAGVLLL